MCACDVRRAGEARTSDQGNAELRRLSHPAGTRTTAPHGGTGGTPLIVARDLLKLGKPRRSLIPLSAQLRNAKPEEHVQALLDGTRPKYCTELGAMFLGDSSRLLRRVPDRSVSLVVTSPPYALHFPKEYGNADKEAYVEWFRPFAREIARVLKPDGSFVLNIGGSYNKGTPTRSLYHFKLLIALVERVGFHLAQECFWFNPAKMPMPAEWVTVRRVRVKDAVEYVWWLSKTPWPKASNSRVLKEYSPDMIRLSRRGVRPTVRPSGHVIRDSFDKIEAGGAIPPNVVEVGLPEELGLPVPEAMLKFGN